MYAMFRFRFCVNMKTSVKILSFVKKVITGRLHIDKEGNKYIKMEKVINKRGKRASEQQKTYLIDYLELHVDLAHDRLDCIDGGRNRELLWSELAEQLNALGGANKDGQKWRKFWLDLKQYSKERSAQIADALSRSGVNGTKAIKPLGDLEKRILAIMTPQAVDGDTAVEEFGVEADTYEDVAYLDEEVGELNPEPDLTTSRGGGEESSCAQGRSSVSAPQTNERRNIQVSGPSRVRSVTQRRRGLSAAAQISEESERFLKIEEKKLKIEEEKLDLKRQRIQIEIEKSESLKDISNSLRSILDKLDNLK